MNDRFNYSFTRYLASKKSVDDRALNKDVWQVLINSISSEAPGSLLKIIEIGAGIGTMVERLLEWGLSEDVEYTGIDSQPENIAMFPERLKTWKLHHGGNLQAQADGSWLVQGQECQILVKPEQSDLFDFLGKFPDHKWDLLIAHAFLDLVDLPTALPRILQLCRPGGWAYFTLNFDGVTTLIPQIDPQFDRQIETLYHRTMDDRLIDGRPAGSSQTGRSLFKELQISRCKILASGASDWVVFPRSEGYQGDEAYFLHFLIDTLERALIGHPNLDPKVFREWISKRHAQIDNCELVYIAHQLDFFVQVS